MTEMHDAESQPHNRQRLLLALTWVLLIAWGAGLFAWWQQQNSRLNPPPETAAPATTAGAGGGTAGAPEDSAADVTTAGGSAAADAAPSVQALLQLAPLSREPGQAAQTRDYMALAQEFDVAAAQHTIETLAAPPYDGRRAGTEGGRAAADFVSRQFAQFDLQPAGDLQADGSRSYLQSFPLDFFVTYTAPPVLEIFAPDGEALGPYEFRHDYSSYVRDYAGQGKAEGPVIWANYCRHDDFDELDAVDAVVLCRQGGGEDVTRNAIEHGAAGLLLIGQPDQGHPIDRIGRYNVPLVPVPLPTFLIDPGLLSDLLAGSAYTADDLTIQFQGLPLETKAHLQVELETETGVRGQNVLGVLPGTDPDYAGQVVVIGGHYDHLGADPDGRLCTRASLEATETCRTVDGATYWGANDNASGIAALLEIARLWQEQGYAPQRTVVFAAWDAEEQGLWGSTYFVQNPSVPLDSVVAYLNLDMVGAGSNDLAIDGPGPVADQLIALAPSFGITTTLEDGGRSDHVPFRTAGVDASMLIWFAGYDADDPGLAHYHRPIDQPSVIEPDKLERAGELATLTLLSLTSTQPDLERLVDQRAAAINDGDRSAFLATSSPARRASDGTWWDDLQVAPPQSVAISLEDPIVVGDVATGTLRYQVQQAGSSVVRRVDDQVRFRRQPEAGGASAWLVDGPALAQVSGTDLALSYPAGRSQDAVQVLAAAEAHRAIVNRRFGRPGAPPQGHLYVHPDKEALQAATGLTLPQNVEVWASGDEAHVIAQSNITRTDALTTAVTQLTLTQSGLREEQAPWLWQGLPLHLTGATARQAQPEKYLGAIQQMLAGTSPLDVADFPSVASTVGGTSSWEAAAWAATGYLLESYDDAQVQALIAGLAHDDVDDAFRQALGQPVADFDAAWQTAWRLRLDSAQAQVDELLARRQEAVQSGDQALFMSTVDPGDRLLLNEEASRFARTAQAGESPASYELTGRLRGITADGVIADLQESRQAGEESPTRAVYRARLPLRDGRLYYGGPQWLTLNGQQVTLQYRQDNASLAEALLPELEEAYAAVTERLRPDAAAQPMAVKLYNSGQELSLQLGSSPPLRNGDSWTAGGESIRLLVQPNDRAAAASDVRNALLDGLAQQVLWQAGVPATPDLEWLRVGLGRTLLQWVDPNTGWLQAGRLAAKVPEAAAKDALWPLEGLPKPDTLDTGDRTLAQGEGWDAVRFLLETYGQEGLAAFLGRLGSGDSQDAAMQAALGVSLAGFEAAWLDSAAAYHIPSQWLALAQSFDGAAALSQARTLASPAYGGREVGTPGGQQAAQAIADAFRRLGLQPAAPDGTFFQTLAISTTVPTAVPSLALRRSEETLTLAYREDFIELAGGHALGGAAGGPLLWIRDPEYTDMHLDGKIVLRKPSQSLDEEVRRAVEAGAGGLILASDVGRNELAFRAPIDLSSTVSPTLPVLELTKSAYESLLAFGGHTLAELNTAPAVLRLSVEADLAVPLGEPERNQGANVLGLLPGANPELADQMLVVSAHYDGPGTDAAGTLYPGANDDGSGVAVMLEIARTWREAGVASARPVLFAAWDGEEMGQWGSRAYLEDPAVPLTRTLGVLNLDGVGTGSGFFLTYEGDRTRESLLNWALATAADALDVRADLKPIEETSDQTAFQEADVPAVLLIWDGADDDANSALDTAATLDEGRLGRTGQVVSLALRWLAEQDGTGG